MLFVFLVDEMNMSGQTQQENTAQKNDQINNEMLSAFIDAEQSDIETSQVIDALLNDPEYKKQYIRTQLLNDHLHEQTQENLLFGDLRKNIALALDDLPAHFSDDAVSLQTGRTEDISRNSWYKSFLMKGLENRMLTGLSVAASVMFVTLFTLQNFNDSSNAAADLELSRSVNFTDNVIAGSNQRPSVSAQSAPTASLIQSPYALPAYLVSAGNASLASGLATVNNESIKQQYQWIEADPVLSRQVREYINGHEKRRSVYDLQPKIRMATYQISE